MRKLNVPGWLLPIGIVLMLTQGAWAGNGLIWLDSTQLSTEFCANELDKYFDRYQGTIDSANSDKDLEEVSGALNTIVTFLRVKTMPQEQIDRWSFLAKDQIEARRAAIFLETTKVDVKSDLPKEPSGFVAGSAWDELVRNPSVTTMHAALAAVMENDPIQLDSRLSLIREIAQTSKCLSEKERAYLTGLCWTDQGKKLEALGVFEDAGAAHRAAQKEYETAGEAGAARVAEALGDRCYEKAAAPPKKPGGGGPDENDPQAVDSNGDAIVDERDRGDQSLDHSEPGSPSRDVVVPLPGAIGINVEVRVNPQGNVSVAVAGVGLGIWDGNAAISTGDTTIVDKVTPSSFFD